MLKEREAVARTIFVLADALVISVAFTLSFFLRKEIVPTFLKPWFPQVPEASPAAGFVIERYLIFLVLAILLWCLSLFANDMYHSMRTQSYLRIIWKIIKAAGWTFLGFGAVLYFFKVTYVGRFFFLLFAGSSFLLIVAEKTALLLFIRYIRRRGRNYQRLLIVGTGPRAASFIRRIRAHPEWGFQILGAIDDEPGRGAVKVDGVDIIGTLDDIPRILHNDAVDEVFFVVPRSRLSHVERALRDCEMEGVFTTFSVDLFDTRIARPTVSELDGVPLLRFRTTKISEWQLLVKRLIDLGLSGSLILICGPFLAAIAVLIKLTSKGPVFFKQRRLGLHGRTFILYKFRTMRQGAQQALCQVGSVAEMDTPEFRARKIRWMTPFGRLMRKFSIDELPQIFNVFLGHMSLVGPRPTVPDEVAKYETWQRRRLSMKPGITCLWQVKGRNNIGFEEWMKLDLEYLDNWSLGLDMKILMKTVPVVLFGIGAY